MIAPTNLYDVLARAAGAFGDAEFLVVGRRAESIGFGTLARQADLFGRALARLGVRPGDRVALEMTNQVDWAVAAYGIARCGATLVGVNTRLSAREIAHMIQLTRPRAWLLEDNHLGKIQATDHIEPVIGSLRAAGLAEPVVVVRSRERFLGTVDWHEMLAQAETVNLPLAAALVAQSGACEFPELDGVAAILSTSGTTAAPKGVMLTHNSLIRLATAVGSRQMLRPGRRFYSVGPFFHCSGYMHGLLTNLIAGSTYFTAQAYTPSETWEVLSRERINCVHGSLIPMQEMSRLPQFDVSQLALEQLWTGAPAAEMARLERVLGATTCELYGLTETGGNVSLCLPDDPEEMRHDSDGRPHDGLEVVVIDPVTGQRLPDGSAGELLVRGWNVMRGYFRDAAATAKTVDTDGWLHTGDLGVRLPGGFIKWLTRIKDVIRTGGENLSPLEVEEVLAMHPSVLQAAVVAAPHPRLQEVPIAFLMLRRGHTLAEEDIRRHCQGQLANFKIPARFVVVEDFPRTTATLRIQKAKLREMAVALMQPVT
jgi:fatty-acyl-CoA synthase